MSHGITDVYRKVGRYLFQSDWFMPMGHTVARTLGALSPPTNGHLSVPTLLSEYADFKGDISAREARHVALVYGTSHYLREIYNHRTARLADALRQLGVATLFSYQRYSFLNPIPHYAGDLLFQCPNDLLHRLLADFRDAVPPTSGRRLAVIGYPSRQGAALVGSFKARGWHTVYDCLDDWEEFARQGIHESHDAESERELLATTACSFAVSGPLAAKLRSIAPSAAVDVLPNAADPRFRQALGDKSWDGPTTVGFIGGLDSKVFDWLALAQIARLRPRIRFEIIGFPAPDGQLPENIKLLGAQPLGAIAELARNWRAGIIPFKIGKLADAVDPLKIYEYFALGLPCVSFRMPQIKNYPYTTTVESVDEFAGALDKAIATKCDPLVLEEFLSRNTWQARARRLLES